MTIFGIPATVYIGAITTTTGTGGTLLTNMEGDECEIVFHQIVRQRRRLNRQLIDSSFQYGDVQVILYLKDQIQKTTDLLLPLFFKTSGANGNQNSVPNIPTATQRLLIIPRTNLTTPSYMFYAPRVSWSNLNDAVRSNYSQLSSYWKDGIIVFDCVSVAGADPQWTLGTADEINDAHTEITA